jgi:hypothetical protein
LKNKTPVSCPTCTFENPNENQSCEICGAVLTSLFQICSKCTHINPADNPVCIRCSFIFAPPSLSPLSPPPLSPPPLYCSPPFNLASSPPLSPPPLYCSPPFNLASPPVSLDPQIATFFETQYPDFKLGKAIDNGDCFFDSCAQVINRLRGNRQETIQSLRQICWEVYQIEEQTVSNQNESKEESRFNWIKALHMKDVAVGYQARSYELVQYCNNDSRLNQEAPIWGRLHIEGLILLTHFSLPALHIIRIHPNLKASDPIPFRLIHDIITTKNPSPQLSENLLIPIIKDGITLVYSSSQNHLVPVMPMETSSAFVPPSLSRQLTPPLPISTALPALSSLSPPPFQASATSFTPRPVTPPFQARLSLSYPPTREPSPLPRSFTPPLGPPTTPASPIPSIAGLSLQARPLSAEPLDPSVQELLDWLDKNGVFIKKIKPIFEEKKISMEQFRSMTEQELQQIIPSSLALRMLLNFRSELLKGKR